MKWAENTCECYINEIYAVTLSHNATLLYTTWLTKPEYAWYSGIQYYSHGAMKQIFDGSLQMITQ